MCPRLLPLPPFLFPFLPSSRCSALTWSLVAGRSVYSRRPRPSLARSMPLPHPHPHSLLRTSLLRLRLLLACILLTPLLIGTIGSRHGGTMAKRSRWLRRTSMRLPKPSPPLFPLLTPPLPPSVPLSVHLPSDPTPQRGTPRSLAASAPSFFLWHYHFNSLLHPTPLFEVNSVNLVPFSSSRRQECGPVTPRILSGEVMPGASSMGEWRGPVSLGWMPLGSCASDPPRIPRATVDRSLSRSLHTRPEQVNTLIHPS